MLKLVSVRHQPNKDRTQRDRASKDRTRRCRDCRSPHYQDEFIIVKDEMWERLGAGPSYRQNLELNKRPNENDVLCFFCIENRLQRKLTFNDLAPTAYNLQWVARIWLRACEIDDADMPLHSNAQVEGLFVEHKSTI